MTRLRPLGEVDKEILKDDKWIRGGIIPFYQSNVQSWDPRLEAEETERESGRPIHTSSIEPGQRIYGMAIDHNTGGLTDFGGRREPYDEDIVATALREYQEESYDVFFNPPLTREDLFKDGLVLMTQYQTYNDEGDSVMAGLLEIFMPLDKFDKDPLIETHKISQLFDEMRKLDENPENDAIIWIPQSILLNEGVLLSKFEGILPKRLSSSYLSKKKHNFDISSQNQSETILHPQLLKLFQDNLMR